MAGGESSDLRVSGSRDEAVKAIVAALPEDAVVRGDDDGIGRFAGERTLVIVERGEGRLLMFQGGWGAIKGRLEQPQLDVRLEESEGGVTVRLVKEVLQKPGVGARISELVGQMVTVAALVVAYHFVRSIPVDWPRTIAIAAAGGLAWSAIGHFMPRTPDSASLEGLVRKALAPMVGGGASGDSTPS